jgi:DNA-binding beta-propeller fold protein YncE
VVLDARSGRILHSTDVGAARAPWLAVDFRTQRALAISGFPHAQVDLIDIRTGRITQVIGGLPLAPMDVAVDTENGYAVVSGSLARGGAPAVALMDVSSGAIVRVVGLQGRAGSGAGPITFDHTAHRILVSSTGGLNILDARTGGLLAYTPLTAGGSPERIAVDRQTHQAFVALLNAPPPGCPVPCYRSVGAFAIVDDRDGRLVRPRVLIPGTTNVGALGVASGAHKLFVTDYGPLNTALDYLYVLDARTGRLLRRVPTDRIPRTLAVDERRNRVIVGGDRGLDVVDAGSGTLLRSINLPDDVGLMHLDDTTGDTVTANQAPIPSRPPSDLISRLLQTVRAGATNVGAYHEMGGSVSVVSLRSIHA